MRYRPDAAERLPRELQQVWRNGLTSGFTSPPNGVPLPARCNSRRCGRVAAIAYAAARQLGGDRVEGGGRDGDADHIPA